MPEAVFFVTFSCVPAVLSGILKFINKPKRMFPKADGEVKPRQNSSTAALFKCPSPDRKSEERCELSPINADNITQSG